MPFGHAQVIMQLIDFDEGDDNWYGTWLDMWDAIRQRMISFEFSDHERKKDQLTMQFRNDDFTLMDNPIFAKGQKLLVTWGWPGQTKPPRRMVVMKVKGGNPVKVTCHDTVSLMDKKKRSRSWDDRTDSEIARDIAGEYGYYGQYLHIEETTIRHTRTQAYKTDARFLRKLARQNGYEFYIDASGLHWHARKLEADPVKTYIYRTDPVRGSILEEPTFDVNLAKTSGRIKVMSRDPRTKQIWEKYGGPDDTEVKSLGLEDEVGNPEADVSEQGLRASRLARVDVRYGGVLTEEETQLEADVRYREVVKGRYKMGLKVIGDGRVGAKILVDAYGIADAWDGLYYVKECIDRIEGGKFMQELKLEKNSLRKVPAAKRRSKGKKEKTNPVTASGEIKEETNELRRKRILTTDSSGQIVLANYWVDESGTAVGEVDYETSAYIDQEKDLLLLADLGAQSVYPDSGT